MMSAVGIRVPEMPHPMFDRAVRLVFLLDVERADYYLTVSVVALVVVTFIQLRAFSRPPPVPTKRLPRRPILQVLFKPDAVAAQRRPSKRDSQQRAAASSHSAASAKPPRRVPGATAARNVFKRAAAFTKSERSCCSHDFGPPVSDIELTAGSRDRDHHVSIGHEESDDCDDLSCEENGFTRPSPADAETPFLHSGDLPDSFAPLLSSSQMQLLCDQLTADLIHAVHMEASLRLRSGRHEIPLDKDSSRPQLILDIKEKTGCRITAVGAIGSDGFTSAQDLDLSKPTLERSCPMLKHAGLVLDPPLPLANVAPTLIHFPTLFEDNVVRYTLRRLQILRYALDFLSSASSFIEKMLWIVESKCQIHLSKVNITPLFKGVKYGAGQGCQTSDSNHPLSSSAARVTNDTENVAWSAETANSKGFTPQWRLSLSFSGHVLICGWIPIPFIGVSLPTFIIPQPHALLEHLITAQPLASARIKRENISEKEIMLAVLDTMDTWNLGVKAVATPPALSIDLTLPGGLTVAVESMHGRDANAMTTTPGQRSFGWDNATRTGGMTESLSGETLSSWTASYQESAQHLRARRHASRHMGRNAMSFTKAFDANSLVPWSLDLLARGKVERDRASLTITKCIATHDPALSTGTADEVNGLYARSHISISGSFVICKPDPAAVRRFHHANTPALSQKKPSLAHLVRSETDTPSVCSVLLFPDNSFSSPSSSVGHQRRNNLLQYDFSLDVGEDTKLDAVSLSVGASHPMLKGGTIITTFLESVYAFGSLTAREGSIMDMNEIRRKRNILRHLPAVDFTAGTQNAFIPVESLSYSDDGQTKCLPELNSSRMMIRVVGGFVEDEDVSASSQESSSMPLHLGVGGNGPKSLKDVDLYVTDGIKVWADIGIGSFALHNEARMNEFPELEIFDDQSLLSLLSGALTGRIECHLRPQSLSSPLTGIGPNIFNPLEAYEVDFSGSSASLKIKEANATLGHRRLIVPTESTFVVNIVESVVDMAFEGKTQCEFCWDFQGSSPILQVTPVGQSPANARHDEREQVPLIISPLRQGRFNLNVSPVGGITITQAATGRENREGLYDWKFFNALISPNVESADRVMKVLHDKMTMTRLLQIIKLISKDLEKILRYILTQVWRAKEIFDQEGVSDPGKAIPGHKMARLMSLFVCGDDSEVDDILPVIRRVVSGDGLDVVKLKELLRKHLAIYEEWAPEIDRAIRFAEVMLGPMEAPRPFVENEVLPLSELPRNIIRFAGIPSAKEIYNTLLDKKHLPLDPSFSNLVSRIAPYMCFRQIEYVLQVRASTDWQPSDLRRLRYVYSVKKKVLDISESYGGLSFLPQSFFVSVFVGEATRASLRALDKSHGFMGVNSRKAHPVEETAQSSTITTLRQRRMAAPHTNYDIGDDAPNLAEDEPGESFLSPAGRVASQANILEFQAKTARAKPFNKKAFRHSRSAPSATNDVAKPYELGDSLLGPQDVAILLQAGLASSMKSSTVVQLNQRMLLDLMASQPRSFAVAVLAEIASLSGGQGSPRGLTSALMALLDLDQSSFTQFHRLDMHALLESWLPGFKIPRREDYLAGGRWARQSYYDAIFAVAKNIIEDAEIHIALKGHIQRQRHNKDSDPVPTAKEIESETFSAGMDIDEAGPAEFSEIRGTKLHRAIENAKTKIAEADRQGLIAMDSLKSNKSVSESDACQKAIQFYREAFDACAEVLRLDKLGFHAEWFKSFYRRNYDALMVKSVYDNVIDDVDHVRSWLDCLKKGADRDNQKITSEDEAESNDDSVINPLLKGSEHAHNGAFQSSDQLIFAHLEDHSEQEIIDHIINLIFYFEHEKETIRNDPIVRLLISNPPGFYNMTIITAMGVITEGEKGIELAAVLERLRQKRGVGYIRSDTGTARSFEYNGTRIEEAINIATQQKKPYGILGYSQGCANGLTAESSLLSGSPLQQWALKSPNSGLVCRQLLFSAANGSMHVPAMEAKVHRLIVMSEEFFKYQQGYCSSHFISTVLEILTNVMDSPAFQKIICGGGGSFLHEGSRFFWREAQHLPHVPTCVIRGVLENSTTPESLEMISNLLTKQSGSALHDSQVHVYDAVGHPVYTLNRNAKILKKCDMGGAVQRTHHWSPLSEEVEFVRTKRDVEQGSFECAKDRHIFPWVDVNARFGIVKYATNDSN